MAAQEQGRRVEQSSRAQVAAGEPPAPPAATGAASSSSPPENPRSGLLIPWREIRPPHPLARDPASGSSPAARSSLPPAAAAVLHLAGLEQKHPSKRPKQIRDLTLLNDYSCDTSCNGVRSGSKEQTTGACRSQNVKRQTQDEPPMTNTCKFALRKPDKATTCRKIVGLLYTSNGNMLLALGSDAVYNLWKRQSSCTNANNKVRLENDTSVSIAILFARKF